MGLTMWVECCASSLAALSCERGRGNIMFMTPTCFYQDSHPSQQNEHLTSSSVPVGRVMGSIGCPILEIRERISLRWWELPSSCDCMCSSMDWVRSRIVHPRSGVSVGGVSGLEGEGDLAVHNNKYLDLYRTHEGMEQC